jgi:pentapeptide repeat protein
VRRGWLVGLVAGTLVFAACAGGGTSDRDDGTKVISGCRIQPNTTCVGKNLAGANLRNAELNGSNLQHVYLAGADLGGADLRGANLDGAVITNADLRSADFSKSKLENVNLTGSDLTDSYFRLAATNNTFAGTIRCRTTLPNGAIDSVSCTAPTPTTAPPTTTTTKPPATTTTRRPTPPTTRPTPPTTRPTPPTTSPAPPPCALNLLQAAYVAKFGLPPDGTTFSVHACVGSYGGTDLANPSTGPAFAVYQVQGSNWVALNTGTAGVCDGLGIPPAIAQQIGCV